MCTKTFIGLLACLIIAGSENGCQHKNVENEKGTEKMVSLTIEQVQEKYQYQWLSLPEVVAVGIGAVEGKKVIKVLAIKKTPELEQKIPKEVEGYEVVIEQSGVIRAQDNN